MTGYYKEGFYQCPQGAVQITRTRKRWVIRKIRKGVLGKAVQLRDYTWARCQKVTDLKQLKKLMDAITVEPRRTMEDEIEEELLEMIDKALE